MTLLFPLLILSSSNSNRLGPMTPRPCKRGGGSTKSRSASTCTAAGKGAIVALATCQICKVCGNQIRLFSQYQVCIHSFLYLRAVLST